MKNAFLLLFLLFIMTSCGDQKIDTRKARLEMEAREIKRVSEGEIVEKALVMGNEIMEDITLDKNPQIGFIVKSDSQLTNSVGLLKLNDLKNYSGGGKKQQVFEAYAYAIENEIASDAGVQILDGDTLLMYTKPALFKEQMIGIYTIYLKRKDIVLSIKK